MKITDTNINGVEIIVPTVFTDERGFFFESYNKQHLFNVGIKVDFIQDNHSKSVQGTLRGLHFQNFPKAQDKLVRCVQGEIFDVAVDVRTGSRTYGEWVGVTLSEDNKKQLLIPKGFAHGFYVLSETAEIIYKCSDTYSPEHDNGIMWNDPDIAIAWPLLNDNPLLSEKDKVQQSFKDLDKGTKV